MTEDNKDLKTTVDEFLTEENEPIKDKSTEEQSGKETDIKCVGEECKMKNRTGLIERVDKKYVTSDGRQLLND